jgi:lipopolysaccharide/colanic/teichoic acid biosynthesis glycosyltransferase
MTRIIDIFISIFAIILFLPFLPIIVFFIKIDSRGPVFYACNRVGLHGKIFKMYKFRTMYETQIKFGPAVCPQGDPRVTSVGMVLRRLKINELPQFYNVLKGDMTLVGPRPEAPALAALYPEEAKVIFTVKPGLAGPNQILGRNEEELYPPGADPVQFYFEHILPSKIPLDVQYIMDSSLAKNLKYIYLAVKITVGGAISRRHLWDHRSQIYLMLADLTACVLSFSLAHLLRYETFPERATLRAFLVMLPLVVFTRIPIFICLGFYQTLIRHLSIFDIKRISKGVAFSSIILVAVAFLSGFTTHTQPKVASYSRSVFLIDWFCLTVLLVGIRTLLKKMYRRSHPAEQSKDSKTVLIWGAGDAGELCLDYLKRDGQARYNVAGFVDDDPTKRGKQIRGYKILGSRHHLKVLAQLYKIQGIFVAITSASSDELQQIIAFCQELGLEAKLFQFRTMVCTNSPQDSVQPVKSVAGLTSKSWIPSFDRTAGKI